jgi:hypothetical protein
MAKQLHAATVLDPPWHFVFGNNSFHAYPVDTQAFPYPLPLVSVAEFQFRFNNSENADIFGTAIGGV